MKMITTIKTIQCIVLFTFMGSLAFAQDNQMTDDQQDLLNGNYVPQAVNNTASLSSSKDQSNVLPFFKAQENNNGLQHPQRNAAGTDSNTQMRNGSFPCDETITSPFAENNQYAGNMFDVTASGGEDVLIDGFDVNLDNAGTGSDIKIYYRTDSYVGNEDSNVDWILLGEETVTSAGIDNPTPVDIGGLLIPAGETYGLYILVENYPTAVMQYTNITGTTTILDSYLTLDLGVGKATPEFTGTTFADRRWNGTIYYSTTECDPYCGPLDFTSAVEPITEIQFAGLFGGPLNNNEINSVPPHQYWLDIESELLNDQGMPNVIHQLTPGQTYPMTLGGNTNGNWVNSFVVFIDWNQNNVLDDAGEVYEFTETIQNSTGDDGQFATHEITVPEDALPGNTRMRIKKLFGTNDKLDPCTGTSYGHVLDFDIRVVPSVVGATPCQETLTGFYNSYLTVEGNMFDITNNHNDDIALEAFDINLFNEGTTTDAEVTVYYRQGSHVGFEESAAGWNTMGQQTITANTAIDINEPTTIDQLTPLTIQPGETYGIYIAVSNGEGTLFTSIQSQARYMENEHIMMEAGAVVVYPDFSTAFTDEGFWNGTVYYCVDDLMSTEQPDAAFDFNFYPNPVENVLNLNASQPIEEISIYTINGQEVMQQQLNNTGSQIEVGHLNPGFYLMNVKINGNSQTHKLLIQ